MKIFLSIFVLVASLSTHAYDYSKQWGIGGSVGPNYLLGGNTFNDSFGGDGTWGAHLRYHICEKCGIELGYNQHNFSGTDNKAKVYDFLAFMRFSPMAKLSPVAGAGLGLVDLDKYNANTSLKLGIKLMAGVEYAFCQSFSAYLKAEYQQINKMIASTNLPIGTIYELSPKIGFTWYFGSMKSAMKSATDTFSDVVKKVESDSDNDGVVDSMDKCQNSPAGAKVNDYGCSETEKGQIQINVNFAPGKTEISETYAASLKSLAEFMSEHSSTTVSIEGHTDSLGSMEKNTKLSQERANAVVTYLVSKLNVEKSRLSAVGHGPKNPIASNKTAEGRAQNRRVVAVISE